MKEAGAEDGASRDERGFIDTSRGYTVAGLRNDRPYLQKEKQATHGALLHSGNAGSSRLDVKSVAAAHSSLEKIADNISNAPVKVKKVVNAFLGALDRMKRGESVFDGGKPLTAKNFTSSMQALGFERKEGAKSAYYTVEGESTTRSSDHSANAELFIRDGTDNNLSIVIRRPHDRKRFAAAGGAEDAPEAAQTPLEARGAAGVQSSLLESADAPEAAQTPLEGKRSAPRQKKAEKPLKVNAEREAPAAEGAKRGPETGEATAGRESIDMTGETGRAEAKREADAATGVEMRRRAMEATRFLGMEAAGSVKELEKKLKIQTALAGRAQSERARSIAERKKKAFEDVLAYRKATENLRGLEGGRMRRGEDAAIGGEEQFFNLDEAGAVQDKEERKETLLEAVRSPDPDVAKAATGNPEERTATPPWGTEDRQIVRFSVNTKEEDKESAAQGPLSQSEQTAPVQFSGGANSHTLTLENAAPVRNFADSIAQNGVKSPAEFLRGLFNSLGSDETNPDKTQYFGISHPERGFVSLRVGNHRATAAQYREHGNFADEKISLVVKMSEKKFRSDRQVRVTELVYFPDKLTAEREEAIAKAVASLIEGDEVKFPEADQTNVSGGEERYSISGRENQYFNLDEGGARRARAGGKDEAEKMLAEGKSRDEIWRTTGWWKAKDGKWRYEVAGLKDAEVAQILNFAGSTPAFQSKSNINEYSFTIGELEKEWKKLGGRLPDSLKVLTTAYPKMRDVKITVDRKAKQPAGVLGWARGSREVHLYEQCTTAETLNHELQHIVQDMGGMAGGANTSGKSFARYTQEHGEWEARQAATRAGMSESDRYSIAPWQTADRHGVKESATQIDANNQKRIRPDGTRPPKDQNIPAVEREAGVAEKYKTNMMDRYQPILEMERAAGRDKRETAAANAGYTIAAFHGTDAKFTVFDNSVYNGARQIGASERSSCRRT